MSHPLRLCLPLCLVATSLVTTLPCCIARADPAPSGTGQSQVEQSQGGKLPTEKPQQTFSIPFIPLPNGHGGPLVHLRVNGQEDATFVADTGAGGNFITEALIAKLGLKTRPALQADGTPWEPFGTPISCVSIDSLFFPASTGFSPLNINLTNAAFAVATPEQMQMAPGFSADGFLGIDFLRVWAISFDFPAHVMSITSPGGLSPAQVKALGFGGKGGATLPLSPCNGNCFSVPALLSNGVSSRRVDLEVDTGGVASLIPLEAAKALSLKSLGTHQIAGGSAGYRVLGKVQLPSLSLGDIHLTGMTVLTTDNLAAPAAVPAKKDPPPELAMDILKGYRVLLDFPARIMYIQPVAP